MKRLGIIGIILFVLGVISSLGTIITRLTQENSQGNPLPPGEGRLTQENNVFSSFFSAWGSDLPSGYSSTQEDAILRIGLAQGSKVILTELKRRDLEAKIAKAQKALKSAQSKALQEWERESEDFLSESPNDDDAENYVNDSTEEDTEEDWDYFTDHSPEPTEDETSKAATHLEELQKEYQALINTIKPDSWRKETEKLAEIAVLQAGSFKGMQQLLTQWGQPYRTITNPLGLEGKRVLILPTGSLQEKSISSYTKFLRSGGTIICMAQARSSDFAGLPGKPEGYGWLETESSITSTVEAATIHPATLSCSQKSFTASADGFFTDKLPKDSQILLRSTNTGKPVAILYPFGEGRIVVTTFFTDWSISHRRPGQQENTFLRDLILWSTAHEDRLHTDIVAPGTRNDLIIPIANDTSEMGNKVRITYLTPEGKICSPFELNLRMLPQEKENHKIKLKAPSSSGIWHLVYALVRADGTILQSWRNGIDLSVGKSNEIPKPNGIKAALISRDETIVADKKVSFNLHLWNYNDKEVTLEVKTPVETRSLRLAPGGEKTLPVRFSTEFKEMTQTVFELTVTDSKENITLTRTVRCGVQRERRNQK